MKYRLITHRKGWPAEIPVETGKHDKDFDVIESEVEDKEWLRARRHDAYLLFTEKKGRDLTAKELEEVVMKPIGFDKDRIPDGMELIEE